MMTVLLNLEAIAQVLLTNISSLQVLSLLLITQ
ncbi:hypothetical protein NIES23_07700 [Trichormus variabilis NIES-23]|uniref:Uncharacterized protein n=2 Tax=Nostocales TaxID=1161 RepID=A0A1Z4KGB7_ANAVA|nr:hypothetical protein NIES23_07700 [Trichormus variabilis NIES-23]